MCELGCDEPRLPTRRPSALGLKPSALPSRPRLRLDRSSQPKNKARARRPTAGPEYQPHPSAVHPCQTYVCHSHVQSPFIQPAALSALSASRLEFLPPPAREGGGSCEARHPRLASGHVDPSQARARAPVASSQNADRHSGLFTLLFGWINLLRLPLLTSGGEVGMYAPPTARVVVLIAKRSACGVSAPRADRPELGCCCARHLVPGRVLLMFLSYVSG